MKDSVVILAGGGPAPGINTVVSTVAKTFLKDGYRVLGLNEGYKNLLGKIPMSLTWISFMPTQF